MKSAHCNMHRQRGSAMVILAIILALGLIGFALHKMGVFDPKVTDPNRPGIMPWKEWSIRQMNELLEPGKYGEQLNLPSITCTSNATDVKTGSSRAEIQVMFSSDGVFCAWSGSYHDENRKLIDVTTAGSDGRFYLDKKFVDENGNEDPSKKWFISAGSFVLLKTGKNVVKIIGGDMYVCGWLDDNNMVAGRIFITSDKKYYEEFTFKGKALKSKLF